MLSKRILWKLETVIKITLFKCHNRGIHRSVKIKNPEQISLGINCHIGENSYLLCWKEYLYEGTYQKLNSSLKIGNNFSATRNLTIQCCNKIVIGNDVLIASNVFICDYNHGINNTEGSYRDNCLVFKDVTISDGVWIGQGVYILPGVHIGKNAIVGAGSVVTKDIPDYSMAVGNPAKVVKIFDRNDNRWHKI